jgi:precorrin-2 dehydrogenase / sirohydrochlorin ferrochelatase
VTHLPIELDVRDREVALIGDHLETRAKIPRLIAAGARVVLFDAGSPLEGEVPEGVELRPGLPDEAAMAGFFVVFASPALSGPLARTAAEARSEGRLFCVLDRPELSTFANPAVIDAGGIGLRIFSGGAAPGLTRRLRQELERAFDDARFARFVVELSRRRRAWPRPERAGRTRRALQGFALEARLRLPSWFDAASEKVPEGADNT